MGDKVYINDVGTIIEIDCSEDISAATDTELRVQKPNGNRVVWTASVYGTYYLRYTILAGDLDIAGFYKIQPRMTLGAWRGRGATVRLPVHDLFD